MRALRLKILRTTLRGDFVVSCLHPSGWLEVWGSDVWIIVIIHLRNPGATAGS